MKSEMKMTRLIQRLQKPHPMVINGKEIDNPFSFGGGYKNGGLSDEIMIILRHIFSFDYMGAAEFEFGAVPKALQQLQKYSLAKTISAGCIENKGESIYYISSKADEEEVKKRILMLRKGNTHGKTRDQERRIFLKEYCGLKEYFEGINEWDKKTCGWLELDNGFIFFTDKEMFDKTCQLFEIKDEK